MNKIFKIVFNAARGKMMVVNEATSSVQTGKKAAVTVAVVGALVAGTANASIIADADIDSSNNTVNLTQTVESNTRYSGIDSTKNDVMVNVADGVVLSIEGTQTDKLANAERLYGVTTQGGNEVVINGDTNIDLTTTTTQVRAIRANNGDLTLNGNVDVDIQTGSGWAIAAEGWSNSTVTIDGNLSADIKTNGGRIIAIQNADSANSTVHVKGDVEFKLQNITNGSGGWWGTGAIQGLLATESTTKFDGNVKIEALGTLIRGICLESNPTATTSRSHETKLEVGGNVDIDVTGTDGAQAIYASGAPGGVHIEGDANLTAKSSDSWATGVYSAYAGDVLIDGATTISVEAKTDAAGVRLERGNGGSQDYYYAGNAAFNSDLTVSALSSDGNAYGILNSAVGEIYDTNDGKLLIEGDTSLTVTASQGKAYGIFSEGANTSVTANGNVSIVVSGADPNKDDRSAAVYAASSEVSLGDAGKIVTLVGESGKNRGIDAVDSEISLKGTSVSVTSKKRDAVQLDGSSLRVNADKAVITSEAAWYGIRAKGQSSASIDAGNVEISSQYAGVYAEEGSTVTLGNADTTLVSVTVSGTGTDDFIHGLVARDPGSSVTVNGSSFVIKVTDPKIKEVYALEAQGISTTGTSAAFMNVNSDNAVINSSGVGVFASGDGEANLNSKTSISVDAPVAIEVRNGAKVNVNTGKDAKADVVLNGNVDFHHAYSLKEGGTINTAEVTLNLNTANSAWNGNVLASWKEGTEPTKEVFEQAKLNLTLANGAQWNPVAIKKIGDLTQTASTFALSRETPTEGQFGMSVTNLNLDGGVISLADGVQVFVDNMEGSGGTVNLGTEGGTTSAGLNVDNLKDGTNLDVNLMNSDLTKELTSDDLTPEQTQELLKSVAGGGAAVTTQVQEGMYNDAFTVNGKDGVVATTTNSVMSNTLDLASAAPLAMNRLLMNDVRKRMGDLRAAEGTHGVWARYDGGKLSGANGLENDFTTVQVGIDTVPVADAPRFGVAFSYTKSDTDMARGSADMDAFSLAFYGTKMYDNGMFVDVIGRMATADTDVTVDGNKKGTMDNVALSLSGELGWRLDVTDKFFFEPQAELTYTYVNADKLALDSSSYEFDAVDSLMGRVGFAAGFKCPSNFGNVYVRASVVHEFLGDATVTGANGAVHTVDGKDTWVEYGIGANFNVNKNTYVYADIERTEGAALEEDWRANVGVRFAF